jgi:hypothetical protein
MENLCTGKTVYANHPAEFSGLMRACSVTDCREILEINSPTFAVNSYNFRSQCRFYFP